MAGSTSITRFRFWLWLIRVIGVLVPRRLRADWRQEWEAELRYRELLPAEWGRLDWRHIRGLLRHSPEAPAAQDCPKPNEPLAADPSMAQPDAR